MTIGYHDGLGASARLCVAHGRRRPHRGIGLLTDLRLRHCLSWLRLRSADRRTGDAGFSSRLA